MTEIEIGLAIQEAVQELENLTAYVSKSKKKTIQELAEKFEKADYPLNMICEKITEELHNKRKLVAASHIRDCLDDKYKREQKIAAAKAAPENGDKAPENRIEESPKPVIIDTSGESVDDETDEQHDPRSENIIQDAVKASMNASGHYNEDQEKGNDYGLKYDYGNAQKEENKIRFELKQDIEKLRQELDSSQAINELLKGEIEASKNQAGVLATDADEIIKNLRIENEQLRHALTRHSFESAKDMEEKKRADPTIENLTNYIKQLEEINIERYNQIQELNKKIESFSHIDKMVEHQPLELDLSDKGGFLGQFFSYRGRKVRVTHDGTKITNIRLGEVNK